LFTGLIEDLGTLAVTDRTPSGARLSVRTGLAHEINEGDSVSVNGVCLTATAVDDQGFEAEVMNQTLSATALAGLSAGERVNLELPVRATDRLGGHIVQGHVDGVGEVSGVVQDGFARRVTIEADPGIMRYLVHRGSVAVDGVSLTIADCDERSFTVSLIPETLDRTNLGAAGPGAKVNLEVDVVAKYVERLMQR
jgi:riboflavin synthase